MHPSGGAVLCRAGRRALSHRRASFPNGRNAIGKFHDASSAPRSSTPSLHRSIRLAMASGTLPRVGAARVSEVTSADTWARRPSAQVPSAGDEGGRAAVESTLVLCGCSGQWCERTAVRPMEPSML
jgi:hypothetical protein